MALVRAFIMRTFESPKWLVSCGRYQEAVDVLNQMSAVNKLDYRISIEEFDQSVRTETSEKSVRENIRRLAGLFSGGKQLRLMSCLTTMWMLIGIA
jgi:cyanophycinase-like exopeptidase